MFGDMYVLIRIDKSYRSEEKLLRSSTSSGWVLNLRDANACLSAPNSPSSVISSCFLSGAGSTFRKLAPPRIASNMFEFMLARVDMGFDAKGGGGGRQPGRGSVETGVVQKCNLVILSF